MIWWQVLIEVCGVAVVAAFLAYFFNRKLQESAQEWEEKRHLIKTFENLCDETIGEAASYWTNEVNSANSSDMQALAAKIGAHTYLLSRFIYENFPHSRDIKVSLQKMFDFVTGDEFGATERQPDHRKAEDAVYALADLRLAISQQAKTRDNLFGQRH